MLSKWIPTGINPNYWRAMAQEFKLIWKVLKDRRTPLYLKAFPFLVGLYLLSPFDLVPAFIPVLGQLDDAGLLLLAMKGFIRLAPQELVAEHTQALAAGV
jgi:uncharacterized membrane protein YkvA (DUF1232 family)